jgi:hypothetical protein
MTRWRRLSRPLGSWSTRFPAPAGSSETRRADGVYRFPAARTGGLAWARSIVEEALHAYAADFLMQVDEPCGHPRILPRVTQGGKPERDGV